VRINLTNWLYVVKRTNSCISR